MKVSLQSYQTINNKCERKLVIYEPIEISFAIMKMDFEVPNQPG